MPDDLITQLRVLAQQWADSDWLADSTDPTDIAYASGVEWGKRIAASDLRQLLDAAEKGAHHA